MRDSLFEKFLDEKLEREENRLIMLRQVFGNSLSLFAGRDLSCRIEIALPRLLIKSIFRIWDFFFVSNTFFAIKIKTTDTGLHD